MAEQAKTYTRFTLSQRLEHWVLIISFTLLVITGMPQRYALSSWADPTIRLLGGIESVRIIHRVAATVLGLGAVYHLIAVAYKIYVLRVRMTMLPGLKDAADMLDTVRHNLGLTKVHPKLPRYNFAEKIEYWALIWGTIVMGITGFILWNPIAAARFLPGQIIPAAKAAHSAEALLATLAIFIWHVYGVHIKTFNKSMFTGRLTKEQMLEEHAGELETIEKGAASPLLSGNERKKRERAFLPVAAICALAMGLGLYAFVTMEHTAITTVPPAEMAQAFVQATPKPTRTPRPTSTPTPTPPPTTTNTPGPALTPTSTPTSAQEPTPTVASVGIPNVLHPLEGREDCLLCHITDGVFPFPADHTDRPVTTCLICHAPAGEQGALPLLVKHDIEGRDDCLQCHALDLLPQSHQETSFASEECLLCHQVGSMEIEEEEEGKEEEEEEEEEEASTSADVSFVNDILPLLEANCATCHVETAMGGLTLADYESLTTGGQNGPAFAAGSPDESLIVAKMKEEHPSVLAGADLQKLIDWIAAGAEDN